VLTYILQENIELFTNAVCVYVCVEINNHKDFQHVTWNHMWTCKSETFSRMLNTYWLSTIQVITWVQSSVIDELRRDNTHLADNHSSTSPVDYNCWSRLAYDLDRRATEIVCCD